MRVRQQFQRAIGSKTKTWTWLAWALSAWSAASSCPCLAQSVRKLAVLALESDQLKDDALARRLVQQVRAVVSERPELQLHGTQASLAQLSFGSGCAGEGSDCLAQVCQKLGVDSLITGRVVHEQGTSLIRMTRFEARTGRVVGSASTSLPAGELAPEQLELRARELVSEVLDFRRAPEVSAVSPAPRPAPAPPAARYAAPAPLLDARHITGYALLGGAVVSTGLSVLSWVQIDRAQSNDSFAAYRRSVGQQSPSTRDVCDEAKSGQSFGLDSSSFARVKGSCSTGRTFEVLQYVFLGGAVVSGGLSAFLLFGGESQKPRSAGSLTLHPSVHRRGASLGARIHF